MKQVNNIMKIWQKKYGNITAISGNSVIKDLIDSYSEMITKKLFQNCQRNKDCSHTLAC